MEASCARCVSIWEQKERGWLSFVIRDGRSGAGVLPRWLAAEDPSDAIRRKIFPVCNDSGPNRKVILTTSYEQLCERICLRGSDESPTKWMQKHYRTFRTAVQ